MAEKKEKMMVDVKLNEATADATAKWWGERLQSGDREKFEASIKQSVLDALNTRGHIYLACDYDPQGKLLDAVHASGLECGGFMFSARGILPQKHETLTKPGSIKPKEGYGNWTPTIMVTA